MTNFYWAIIAINAAFAISLASFRWGRGVSYLSMVFIVIFISGIRYKTGYDYDNYVEIYNNIALGSLDERVEYAWFALNMAAYYGLDSPSGVFFFSSLLIYVPIAWILYKESKYAAVAFTAFIFGVQFYWESLSILRQYVGISFALLASWRWIKGRKTDFILFLIIAILFHTSAILALITPIIVRWSNRKSFFLIASLGSFLLSLIIPLLVFNIGFLMKYEPYFDGSIVAAGEVGSGLVVYVKALMALSMVFLIQYAIDIQENKKNLIANSIILGYSLFFCFYESTALRRVSYYFLIYELFAIAYVFEIIWSNRKIWVRLISAGIVFFYMTFSLIIMDKDVWSNPYGKQEDSQYNYEYQSIVDQ